jgi:hypothetical protein
MPITMPMRFIAVPPINRLSIALLVPRRSTAWAASVLMEPSHPLCHSRVKRESSDGRSAWNPEKADLSGRHMSVSRQACVDPRLRLDDRRFL